MAKSRRLADMVDFLIFLIKELRKKSCLLFGVVFAILRCKFKASKGDDGENYLQTMRHRLKITKGKRLQVLAANQPELLPYFIFVRKVAKPVYFTPAC